MLSVQVRDLRVVAVGQRVRWVHGAVDQVTVIEHAIFGKHHRAGFILREIAFREGLPFHVWILAREVLSDNRFSHGVILCHGREFVHLLDPHDPNYAHVFGPGFRPARSVNRNACISSIGPVSVVPV